ncbi:MAG: sufB, partial [Thermoleophilia bacterium]|nr:sufB [Thermoleophilia bacterium]
MTLEPAAAAGTLTDLTDAEKDAVEIGDYKYGFSNDDSASNYAFKSAKGLSEQTVRDISAHKNEPEWMLEERLKAYQYFLDRPMPDWGADLSGIDFNDIYYYIKPT